MEILVPNTGFGMAVAYKYNISIIAEYFKQLNSTFGVGDVSVRVWTDYLLERDNLLVGKGCCTSLISNVIKSSRHFPQ